MNHRIRAACLTDQGAIRQLETLAFARPWSSASIHATLRDPLTYVWIAEPEAASRDMPTELPIHAWAATRLVADEAELLRIATHPGHRRQGLARQLLTRARPLLREAGVRMCHLEVRADNDPALALYHALGFRPTGRRSRYYHDGSDALILTCLLCHFPDH